MNPSPLPLVQPLPRLIDRRSNPPRVTPVSVVRGFPPDRLAEVERSWGPSRDQLADAMARVGQHLESWHWRWTRKDTTVRAGEHLLVSVECEGEVQGLMALRTELRAAVITPGQWVMYVDYIEAAPWNQRAPGVQEPRFLGVGTLLIGEAVRTAAGRSASCRVGLHALPQAEPFYTSRCGMTRIGPDPGYHNLVYFEYPDGVADVWLTTMGLSA